MSQPEFLELKKRLSDIESLRSAGAVLYWDQSTLMPEGGARFRGEQLAVIHRLAHELGTAPELGRLLDQLSKQDFESEIEAGLVRVAREDFIRQTRVPTTFVEELSSHTTSTYHLWKVAREAQDFSKVLEALRRTLDMSRRYASFFPGFDHCADALIDENDPGSTVAELRPLFAELRSQLVPLANMILSAPAFDDACLRQEFDEDRQLEFGRQVISKLGYDWRRGRQDKTAHPFMIRFNTGDVRITTRVKKNELSEALFSTIHEAGHALYELGIGEELEGTPLAHGTSSGVHESQSRLWENIVGRSRPFWDHFYGSLQRVFPQQLGHVPLDQFHRAINRVSRGLIRTDADEVTYNLHVMIRFDLELDLLEDRLKLEDLPEAWNARYESDLGIRPDHAGDGVLQDVHWYAGLIGGAFQGYTLGNILSAQLLETARRDLPTLDDEIRGGEFGSLRRWLGSRLHSYGRLRKGPEAIRFATGRDLEISPYMNYLESKYRALLGSSH